jgi:prevent-host-death family protein
MHYIRPLSDLRNRTNEISELCHKENQPVFITRNGYGDLVVMSLAHYEQLLSQLQLYQKLHEAEALAAAGEQGISHAEMMAQLKARIS